MTNNINTENLNVSWHEGMFLSPPVFQQHDLFFENRINKLICFQYKPYYGYLDIKIDEKAMNNGIINLQKASGFFPDKTYFELDERLYYYIDKTIEDDFLCLSLPNNFFYSNDNNCKESRYITEDYPVKDRCIGIKNEFSVKLSHLNLALKLKSDIVNNEVYLELLHIKTARKNDKIILEETFIPPLLKVACNTQLVNILENIINHINIKILEIINKLKYIKDSKDEILQKMYLQTLTKYHVLFQQEASKYWDSHPEHIYLLIHLFYQEILAYDPINAIRKIARYDQNDISTSIMPLAENLIEQLKLSSISEKIIIKPKIPNKNLLILDEINYKKIENKDLIISVKKDDSINNLYFNNFDKIIKVSGLEKVYELVKYGLLGIPIKYFKEKNDYDNEHYHNIYFKINNEHLKEFFINEKDILTIYMPDELENIVCEFYLIDIK